MVEELELVESEEPKHNECEMSSCTSSKRNRRRWIKSNIGEFNRCAWTRISSTLNRCMSNEHVNENEINPFFLSRPPFEPDNDRLHSPPSPFWVYPSARVPPPPPFQSSSTKKDRVSQRKRKKSQKSNRLVQKSHLQRFPIGRIAAFVHHVRVWSRVSIAAGRFGCVDVGELNPHILALG